VPGFFVFHEPGSLTCRGPCGSGFTREEGNEVNGTGYAGVRG